MRSARHNFIIAALTLATNRRDYFVAKRRASRLTADEQFACVDAFVAARARIFGVEKPKCRCFACTTAKARAHGVVSIAVAR